MKERLTFSFTIPVPQVQFLLAEKIHNVVFIVKNLLLSVAYNFQSRRVRTSQFLSNIPSRLPRFNKKNFVRFFLPVGILILVFILIKISIGSRPAKSSPTTLESEALVKAPLSKMDINKAKTFPILDSRGKEVASFTYVIQDAELRDEIIVKGRKATAVEGRIFLILNLKLSNSTKQGLQINARDFVRLAVNNKDGEWLAAEIHNDPVEVQAISTKYTRLGFAINRMDKDLVLQFGEIEGEKQPIKLSL